jgi:hypothetical protein
MSSMRVVWVLALSPACSTPEIACPEAWWVQSPQDSAALVEAVARKLPPAITVFLRPVRDREAFYVQKGKLEWHLEPLGYLGEWVTMPFDSTTDYFSRGVFIRQGKFILYTIHDDLLAQAIWVLEAQAVPMIISNTGSSFGIYVPGEFAETAADRLYSDPILARAFDEGHVKDGPGLYGSREEPSQLHDLDLDAASNRD